MTTTPLAAWEDPAAGRSRLEKSLRTDVGEKLVRICLRSRAVEGEGGFQRFDEAVARCPCDQSLPKQGTRGVRGYVDRLLRVKRNYLTFDLAPLDALSKLQPVHVTMMPQVCLERTDAGGEAGAGELRFTVPLGRRMEEQRVRIRSRRRPLG